ncbi:MAG TPA: porin family protein [Epsilonproteobacteria bacterium]|nr:porin family protein [Campylobacterota bacterium]
MRKLLTMVSLGLILISSQIFAGGKYVSPAMAVVEPIPVQQSPVPVYLGLGLVAAAVSKGCPCSGPERLQDMTYGVIFRAGWDINQYLGLEARYIKASLEEDFSQTTHYGLYLKPQYHFIDSTNIYALLGYGRTIIDYDNQKTGQQGKTSTVASNGFSYGLGIEYDLSDDESLGEYDRAFDGQGDEEKGWGLWADYQHLLNNEGSRSTDSNLFTTGLTYDF